MYNFIKGKIIETFDNTVVVECGGVGYELNVSTNAINELSAENGEVKIYCKLTVREDDMSLFGFSSKQEKAMFEKLIGISGVGPKLAITVLSGLTVSALASAIVSGNVSALSKVKGVGKKTAERIVLELKDKVGEEYESEGAPTPVPSTTVSVNEDAVLALMTLGFSRPEATASVAAVQKDGMTLEQLIFTALKNS